MGRTAAPISHSHFPIPNRTSIASLTTLISQTIGSPGNPGRSERAFVFASHMANLSALSGMVTGYAAQMPCANVGVPRL